MTFIPENYSEIEFEKKLIEKIPSASSGGIAFKTSFAFRSVPQKYANLQDAISGIGSLYSSGRYNVGRFFGGAALSELSFEDYRFKVLYLSCDLSSCIAEIEYYALKDVVGKCNDKEEIARRLAQTLVGVNLNISKCLDLTDERTLFTIGLINEEGNPDENLLKLEWFPFNFDGKFAPTQLIAKVARDKGYEALIVPSARKSDGCGMSINILHEETIVRNTSIVNPHLLPDRMLDFYIS